MSIQLQEGVNIHVLPTKKYKTIRIVLKFRTPLDKKNITKRALLSSLLETNSKKYNSQTKLRSELANLYGASFGLSVTKKGTMHMLTVGMTVVNEKYLSANENVLQEGIDFLKEILFHPNVTDGKFDEETFNREKENLADYYESIFDDKQAYASLSLQRLYFEDENQKTPSIGTLEDLNDITAASLYEYYQELLAEDCVDIYVLGDVEESEMTEAFRAFPFKARQVPRESIFYTATTHNKLIEEIEEQEVTQAKFNLAYETNVFYQDKTYFAAQIFNGLFGGFPHSKLFMNVREKESLAYYASSTLDTFRGMMTVQTGIDSTKVEQVREIIQLQLIEMQNGNFSGEAIDQTKEMLKNQVLQSEDNPGAVMEKMYTQQLVGSTLTTAEFEQKINEVTKEEIIKIANQVYLKATFFLTGEENK